MSAITVKETVNNFVSLISTCQLRQINSNRCALRIILKIISKLSVSMTTNATSKQFNVWFLNFLFRCGKKNSVRHPCIEVPPNILIIQLKRFRYNGSKNHVEIVFPLGLNLSKFGSDKEQGLQYRLYGFISHSGVSANSGHYKATMFGYNKQWYQFDDEYVSKAEPSRFDQRQPYLLFYHKAPPSLQVPRSSAVFNLNNQNSNKSSVRRNY